MASHPLSRRRVLTAAAGAGAGALAAGRAAGAPIITPSEIEGPFYPVADQADKDADLTRIKGREGVALGEVITVEGRVLGPDGEPLDAAVVDVWQANAAGRYAHPAERSLAPLDPNFQGWAIMATNADGAYRFTTIKPGAYRVSRAWERPPHIHFRVSRRGFRDLTTQMYFDAEPLNDIDRLLQDIPEAERPALIATPTGDASGGEPLAYRFDVVLAAV